MATGSCDPVSGRAPRQHLPTTFRGFGGRQGGSAEFANPNPPRPSEGTITRASRNPTFAQKERGPSLEVDFPAFKAEKGPQKICAKPWLAVIRA